MITAGSPVFVFWNGTAPSGVPARDSQIHSLAQHSTPRYPVSLLTAPVPTPRHSTAPRVLPPARAAPQGAPTRHHPHPIPLSCHPCHLPGKAAAAPAGNAEARALMSQVRPEAATPVLAPWHCLQHQCRFKNPGLMESPWKGTHNLPLQLEWPQAQPSGSSAHSHAERDPWPWCCSFGDVLGT